MPRIVLAIVAFLVYSVHYRKYFVSHLLDIELVGVLEAQFLIEVRREAILLVYESLFVFFVESPHCRFAHPVQILLDGIL